MDKLQRERMARTALACVMSELELGGRSISPMTHGLIALHLPELLPRLDALGLRAGGRRAFIPPGVSARAVERLAALLGEDLPC